MVVILSTDTNGSNRTLETYVIRTASCVAILFFVSLSTALADPGTVEDKLLSENQAKGINTTEVFAFVMKAVTLKEP